MQLFQLRVDARKLEQGVKMPGMTQFAHERIRGSLWARGTMGIIVGGVVVLGLLVWVPAIRWFLAIAAVIGLAMAAIIHWYNEHTPVKVREDKVVLHLNDEEPLSPMESDQNRKVG